VPGLLLLVAAGDERRPAVQVADEGAGVVEGEGRVRLGELLVPDHLLDVGEAPPPVLDGPVDARPATLVERALPGEVELAHLPPLGRSWFGGEVLAQPGARLLPERLLLGGQVEVHGAEPSADLTGRQKCGRPRGRARSGGRGDVAGDPLHVVTRGARRRPALARTAGDRHRGAVRLDRVAGV